MLGAVARRSVTCNTRGMIHAIALGALASAAAVTQVEIPVPEPRVGVVTEPCAKLEPRSLEAVRFLERAKQARIADRPTPKPGPEEAAALASSQQTARWDPSGLCRHEAANKALPPASSVRLVFMGDSITEFWPEIRPGYFSGDRVGRGIGGQTTHQMAGRFRADVIRLKPQAVHILAGINDIAGNGGPTDIARITGNIETMVELSRANNIRVYLGTVLPARAFDWRPEIDPGPSIEALNSWIRNYGRRSGLTVVDYHTALDDGHGGLAVSDSFDGVHPNRAGYARMEQVLNRALAQQAKR